MLHAEEFSILDKTSIITIELEKIQYNLGYDHIITGSEEVSYQDSILAKGKDYSFDYVRGVVSFIKELESGSRVKITFKVFPKSLLYSFQQFTQQDNILEQGSKEKQTSIPKQKYDTSTESEYFRK